MNFTPSAILDGATIGPGCEIGPYVVLTHGVVLGNDLTIHPHVTFLGPAVVADRSEIFPGAIIGKPPKSAGALAREPRPASRLVTIGSGCSIGPNSVIYVDVDIADGCLIGDGASIREQSRVGAGSVIGRYVTINYNVRIGRQTKVMDHTWLAGNMTIGDHVFISGGVLTTNDNRPSPNSYDDAVVIGQTIEDSVVVGAGATFLPAVKAGKGAVVAAGATVTRDVAPAVTVIGPAARPIDRDGSN